MENDTPLTKLQCTNPRPELKSVPHIVCICGIPLKIGKRLNEHPRSTPKGRVPTVAKEALEGVEEVPCLTLLFSFLALGAPTVGSLLPGTSLCDVPASYCRQPRPLKWTVRATSKLPPSHPPDITESPAASSFQRLPHPEAGIDLFMLLMVARRASSLKLKCNTSALST